MEKQRIQITREEILRMDTRQRAALVNALPGFKSLALIGTRSAEGKNNLAVFNSIVHIGSHPPCIGFISRPDSVDRHTLANIRATGEYTLNHVNASIYRAAHQTSARYPQGISEFDATGLTPVFYPGQHSPFVQESGIQLSMKLDDIILIPSHGNYLVTGSVQHVYLPDGCWCEDGFVDLERSGTIASSGLDSYHRTKRLARLSYAKPDSIPVNVACNYKKR